MYLLCDRTRLICQYLYFISVSPTSLLVLTVYFLDMRRVKKYKFLRKKNVHVDICDYIKILQGFNVNLSCLKKNKRFCVMEISNSTK